MAGVKIIGLGWGDSRPTFTFGHANASVTVGAAGVWLENLRINAGITAVLIVGPCSNMRVLGCEFMGDYSTACLNSITALSQGLMFLNNIVHNADADEPYLEVFAGTTGVIANTRGLAKAATVAANAVANAMVHAENFVANTAGTIPVIYGAAGVPALDVD